MSLYFYVFKSLAIVQWTIDRLPKGPTDCPILLYTFALLTIEIDFTHYIASHAHSHMFANREPALWIESTIWNLDYCQHKSN